MQRRKTPLICLLALALLSAHALANEEPQKPSPGMPATPAAAASAASMPAADEPKAYEKVVTADVMQRI